MRWAEFRALRRGDRVVWTPSGERGRVVRVGSLDELWVRWDSHRLEKLVAAEDCYGLSRDTSRVGLATSVRELHRRELLASMRVDDEPPGAADQVWAEARRVRAERESSIDPRPSVVAFGPPKRYGRRRREASA